MRNFIGVVLAAGAMAPALGAQQLVPGWVVEQHTSVTMAGATSPTPMSLNKVRITAAKGELRMDMLDGPTIGEYTLASAKQQMMFLMVPARRVAREMPMDSTALASIMPRGMTYNRGAMKVDTLGDGPVMLGYRTRHYRVTPTRLAGFSLPGFGADTLERTVFGFVADYFVTDQLPELETAGSQQRLQSSAPGAVPGFTGLPLRTEVHMEMGSGGMKSTSVTEVTSVARRDVDPALFAVPADYVRVSFVDEMRALRARTDSLMQSMQRDYPGLAADIKAKRDSILGIRDTTKAKKP